MNAAHPPSARLEAYLDAWRVRLRRLRYLIAAAALAGAALLITVLGVYLAMRQGFGAWVVNGARVLLLLALLILVLWLLVWPLRRLQRGASGEIEARAPDFAGRLEAFNTAREQHNPLTELLAEDTLQVAARFPVQQTIRPRELGLPLIIACASLLTLLWLAIAGPGLWSYGTRYLWAGWAVSSLKPAQSILVKPGDHAVRRGGNVPVLAQMQGFAPGAATVYVQMDTGAGKPWQQVAMTRTDAGFAFTFFSVRETLKYYVAAAGVRSPDYSINVVDLPNINNLKLTYTFPKWTGRKPEVQEPGGDIAALRDTRIDLEISADAALPPTELVLNDATTALHTEGARGRAEFAVRKEGRYYLAARVAGESVRLSDDYFIRVLEDAKPEIKVVRPGRDYGASSIEEVTAHIDASDDYGLNAVELHYAVNGAGWQTIKLDANRQRVADDHVFALETLGEQQALKPGDLISYYALARDHSSTVRTDMYFIDVRPFDKRFAQSQQSGGGGGGGAGGGQDEISQRQREIIVSTWNLIREQDSKQGDGDKIEDNSRLLSELQTKLAAQAGSLTQRMQARELDSSDAQAKEFADNMKQAIAAMTPAARALQQVELAEAIQPEQQALQYILRAEAVFNDIQVQQQAQGGQGGGQQDSRDMAQIYELEMDLNKNQYESRNNASPEQRAETQDELQQKLKELARRQQQLANTTRQQQQLTQEQRWQQESLKREAEQLQRQLQNMQAQNQQGSQSGQQQGQQSGQQSGQASGQSSAQAGSQTPANGQNQELQQRLQSAIRAMDESARAMRNTGDAGERSNAQRAAAEAQRQLSGASDAVARGQQQALQGSLNNLVEQAAQLYEQQAQFDRALQDTVQQLRKQNRTDRSTDEQGLTAPERQLAADKRALATRLQNLRRDMVTTQRALREQAPQTEQQIANAAKDLDENKIDQRMSVAATYIERGAAPFVVASESMVTDSLRELRDELRQAAAQGAGAGVNNDKADAAVAQVRALRQQLEQLNNRKQTELVNNPAGTPGTRSGNQPGNQPGNQQEGQTGSQPGGQGQRSGQGQGQSQQQGQTGQGGQAGNQGGTQGGQANGGGGPATNGWFSPNTTGTGPARNPQPSVGGNLNDAIRDARAAIAELNQRGRLNQQEAQQLQDLTRQLDAMRIGGTGTGIRSGAEPTALALVEQLELKLAKASERRTPGKQGIRSTVAEPVPADYEDAVAEYYRRLSKD